MARALSDAVGLSFVDSAIRNDTRFFDELGEQRDQAAPVARLQRTYAPCTALYGLVMGSFHGPLTADGWRFALATMVKVPLLFLLTTAIVLPAIYISNTLLGGRLRFGQTAALFMSAMTVSSVMLAACAPILLFFMLCTDSYAFIKLFNVAIFAVSGLYGVVFFLKAGRHLRLFEGAAAWVLRLWLLAWALVGAQMAWVLRPFIGSAHQPFQLFREQESNFYLNLLQTVGDILGH